MSKLLNIAVALFAIYVIANTVSPHRQAEAMGQAERAAAASAQAGSADIEPAADANAAVAQDAAAEEAAPESEDNVVSFQGVSIDLEALQREICANTTLCA